MKERKRERWSEKARERERDRVREKQRNRNETTMKIRGKEQVSSIAIYNQAMLLLLEFILFYFAFFFKQVDFILPSLFHRILHACSHFNVPLLSLFRGRIPILYYDAFARSFSILLLVNSHCAIFEMIRMINKNEETAYTLNIGVVEEEEEKKLQHPEKLQYRNCSTNIYQQQKQQQ